MKVKIVSGFHPLIPTPPLLYGGTELEAALTANALIEAGFTVCLDASRTKTWDYFFTTPPPGQCAGDVTISYVVPIDETSIHVFQGRPIQISNPKVFASQPQKDYYINFIADVDGPVIPNAIPEWFYEPRERWDDGDYYLFMNRCDKNKGCKEFVDWCIQNHEKCIMITQNWFVEDPEYTKTVLDKAVNNGIQVKMNVDPLEKIELLKGAKAVVAFLSRNYFEGYGIWAHEANWLRVPVISTNVQAIPWTIMRGEINGKKVEKDENEWRKERSYRSYKEAFVKLVSSINV